VTAELAALAQHTRRSKGGITGSSWWLIAQVFRVLGGLGVNRWLVDRQRSITTLPTNIRGPAEPLQVLGRRVTRAVPVATLVGNVTTSSRPCPAAGDSS
jgi:diacylglycerol O-acyltransferase